MVEDLQRWKKKRRRLWLAVALLVFLLAVVVMPPMVSISRYKNRITELMSESVGRPVRLSSVELRLLPRPGFVLTDLTVEEDPGFGAEPLLRANTVTASIRLLSLWRGRMEISTISVDEASLNIVRTADGRWNLDPLFRTAAAKTQTVGGGPTQAARGTMQLPYMEATNSRINFKRGAEKLPFSLVETDLSFWQENPGDWRIRLRGQPERTDLSLDFADTGEVRLEGRAQRAAELRKMPVHVDLEWRAAQLGQLTRLVLGSDSGWRGDLTGELHLDGTADAAHINTRLRATGVHREEFAPASPLDFDATCNLVYRFSQRATDDVVCDSPLGDGRIRLTGDLPGNGHPPRVAVELDRIPVGAGLDALRTVRSDFGPGIEAVGSVSGKLNYDATEAEATAVSEPVAKPHARTRFGRDRTVKARPAPPGPLTGSLHVDGFALSGAGSDTPVEISKAVFEPVAAHSQVQPESHGPEAVQPVGLQTVVNVAAGGANPLAITVRLAASGYQLTARGQVSFARAREFAQLAGFKESTLDALAGEPASVDLSAAGPWMPSGSAKFATQPQDGHLEAVVAGSAPGGPGNNPASIPAMDTFGGTVTLHNATWKAGYLANRVEIAQAVLHLGDGEIRWDPVTFSYGPVKGTASLSLPEHCADTKECEPRFQARFSELDVAALQAAILGAHEPGTLLSTLLDRLSLAKSATSLAWPPMTGTLQADSLKMGPVTLTAATASLRVVEEGAEIDTFAASVLGGNAQGSGKLHAAGSDQAKPSYAIEVRFEKLSPAAVGQIFGWNWSGRTLDGTATLELEGFTDKDLAASAKGTLHFDWRRGSIELPEDATGEASDLPSSLTHFDRWTGDAEVGDGSIKLTDNQIEVGVLKHSVEGTVRLSDPPEVRFAAAKATQAKR